MAIVNSDYGCVPVASQSLIISLYCNCVIVCSFFIFSNKSFAPVDKTVFISTIAFESRSRGLVIRQNTILLKEIQEFKQPYCNDIISRKLKVKTFRRTKNKNPKLDTYLDNLWALPMRACTHYWSNFLDLRYLSHIS